MEELQLKSLQEKLNYSFENPALLVNALTHSSYANEKEKNGITNNERLEFFGDSLLGMTVALLLFESEPKLTEGQMTKLRAQLVCERSLAELAGGLDLGDYLLLGRGEDKGGGRSRPSILSDALEAVLAAMYFDGGFQPVFKLISEHFTDRIKTPLPRTIDYKTKLQEIVQKKQGQAFSYEVTEVSGPDHDKTFSVEVKLNGETVGEGKGKTKKSAEQDAAKAAVNTLKNPKGAV